MTINQAVANTNKRNDKDLPYEDGQTLGLGTDFTEAVNSLRITEASIKQLTEEQEALRERIKAQLGERGRDRARVGDVRVLVYKGESATLGKERLLENGVPMDKIEASINRTPYLAVKLIKD